MTVQPFDDIPEAVWRAREAEDAYREQAEKDWDKYLAAKKPIRPLTQTEELVLHAVMSPGMVREHCPNCYRLAWRLSNIYACWFCHIGWDADDGV